MTKSEKEILALIGTKEIAIASLTRKQANAAWTLIECGKVSKREGELMMIPCEGRRLQGRYIWARPVYISAK